MIWMRSVLTPVLGSDTTSVNDERPSDTVESMETRLTSAVHDTPSSEPTCCMVASTR